MFVIWDSASFLTPLSQRACYSLQRHCDWLSGSKQAPAHQALREEFARAFGLICAQENAESGASAISAHDLLALVCEPAKEPPVRRGTEEER